jgi:hypothetical protein
MNKINLTKDETPSVRGKGFQENTNGFEFTPEQKRLATIIAQMVMAGHQVHRLEHGFLVTRWGMSRHCPDLGSLAGFARQIGACHA